MMSPVCMVLIIKLASVFCSSFSSTAKHPFARYEKTRIIDFKCDKSWFIKTVQTRNIYHCGLICNEVTDCRRYLFCNTQSECKLYGDGTDCIHDGDATGCHCFRKLIGCNAMNCVCPWGYYGHNCQNLIKDCHDGASKGFTTKAITRIKPNFALEAFDVECIMGTTSYLSILYRLDKCKGDNFNRTFYEYEKGFGIVPWNSWLGLQKIQNILNNPWSFSLRILFSDNEGSCNTFYDNFKMGNASTKYQFQASINNDYGKRKTCGDAMTGENNTLDLRGRPFSTYDQDETSNNCAAKFGGGWWFADHPNCSDGFLMATEISENIWSSTFWNPGIKIITMKLISHQ